MVVVVFHAKARPNPGPDYDRLGERMLELVRTMPGFLSAESYSNGTEDLTVVEFESEPELEAWRVHPEHLAAQRAGREQYFESYRVQVCSLIREAKFEREG